jgi:mannose-6-phosphate isomerase-like protein (cupin superfamily)
MTTNVGPFSLSSTYLRLRSDVSIEALAVDADFWNKLAGGRLGNFHNEYLVTTHEFDADWPHWEMHPNGDEVVCLLAGQLVFILETDGKERRVTLDEVGQFVIVPQGTWHTANTNAVCRMLFITAGEGTQHRPCAPA